MVLGAEQNYVFFSASVMVLRIIQNAGGIWRQESDCRLCNEDPSQWRLLAKDLWSRVHRRGKVKVNVALHAKQALKDFSTPSILIALLPGKTRYPLYRRLGGPQSRSRRVRKISSTPGFDSRTVQLVASGYTD